MSQEAMAAAFETMVSPGHDSNHAYEGSRPDGPLSAVQ